MISLHKILPICAIASGLTLVGVTNAYKTASKTNDSQLTEYYFAYNLPTGQEADESKWEPINQLQYENSGCNGDVEGCVLRTTTVTGSGTAMRPETVNVVTQNGQLKPILGDGVDQVHNLVNPQ